ncbi:hypothetical protein IQ241_12655 [Romeria aff. gracilis LEGE 07310]|uniref:Uncharacterized protein n=1 Tax=Vasconcelosia minhoensis LEGE 07310 TaxID=915328 RepID=A0A8J7AE66_9CYAN|nr:hypothetical protein [Romeria gracilis]MBE9078131.1 hypothetical protein [Romeria aff. gracilis LEGE 07310]
MPAQSKPSDPRAQRIALYFLLGLSLSALLAVAKAALAWAAATYLYSLPYAGGFLKSVELVEISNLLIFLLLGLGIGAATRYLPQSWPMQAKVALLVVVTPLVFSASYVMQQALWVRQVAERAEISPTESRQLTNGFLRREVGSGGFWGFFSLSTQMTDLPTQPEILQTQLTDNPNVVVENELAKYEEFQSSLISVAFRAVGWAIRLMYITIAALAAAIYYAKGQLWADQRRQAKAEP